MSETIRVDIGQRGIAGDLAEVLAAHGLHAERDGDGGDSLHVRFVAGEEARLRAEVTAAIEEYLSDRMLPLVVQHADGGCIVRPPAE
jgi:hypothetical protein